GCGGVGVALATGVGLLPGKRVRARSAAARRELPRLASAGDSWAKREVTLAAASPAASWVLAHSTGARAVRGGWAPPARAPTAPATARGSRGARGGLGSFFATGGFSSGSVLGAGGNRICFP